MPPAAPDRRRPAVAVLDEVTASVSAEAAVALYRALQAAGITCVSIGQDCEHLRAAHTHHLRLGLSPHAAAAAAEEGGGMAGEGAWQLEEVA